MQVSYGNCYNENSEKIQCTCSMQHAFAKILNNMMEKFLLQ